MRSSTRRLLMVATAVAAAASASATADDGAPSPARQRELIRLLRNDCGACHGMRLAGGLGPALTPEALKDKPPESLAATIVYGRAGTPMPPWRPFVTETEARWLVTQLQRGAADAR
jgi:cytochrome c55X